MKTVKKLLWLSLMAAGLVILVPSGQLIAQENRVDLTLRMLPGYYYREIVPEEESILYIEIRNAGNQAITNIRLVSDNPKGWIVSLKPDSIDYLGAGSSQTIDLSVMAPAKTERGDYTLTLIAESSQTHTATSTVLRVETAFSFWLWVGAGLGALVIAAFVILYLRFGRE